MCFSHVSLEQENRPAHLALMRVFLLTRECFSLAPPPIFDVTLSGVFVDVLFTMCDQLSEP